MAPPSRRSATPRRARPLGHASWRRKVTCCGSGARRWRPGSGARSACSLPTAMTSSKGCWPRCRCASGAQTRSLRCRRRGRGHGVPHRDGDERAARNVRARGRRDEGARSRPGQRAGWSGAPAAAVGAAIGARSVAHARPLGGKRSCRDAADPGVTAAIRLDEHAPHASESASQRPGASRGLGTAGRNRRNAPVATHSVAGATSRQVAIITGGSQGIGAGLVAAYRHREWAVVANSRTIRPGADPAVVAVAGDVSDPTTVEQIVAAAMASFGRIDTLVNNAGVFIAKPFTAYTDADFATAVSVNLTGFFRLTQRVIAEMLTRQAGGHIVNVTTTLVDSASSELPAALTALTKGGVAAATKSLAIEYASRGIRV